MSTSNRKGRSGHHSRGKYSHSDKREEEAPPEVFSRTLSIVVYRGDPIDSHLNRHTAFYIEYSDGSNVLSYITGASGFFEFDRDGTKLGLHSKVRHLSVEFQLRQFNRVLPRT
ncbi:uncharacterized protein LY89DRAFT_687600 [Mollisia scopiformis]|uniref:Uncharacterized protein n=1 Tax=Mollisia scopiformis TaxID=149040 RepID=A0A194X016_MOLSC|nr:uncharacterized protein LY89DRAFT_687600 [Mollisia scopiformis]KUJ13541.1 hypothetical protein LY89DRAFT_687600 [Mollisia scopiformis]